MPVDRCRVCAQELSGPPLLRYAGMPAAAQFLPDAAMLADDRGMDLELCQCPGCGLAQLRNDPVPYYREVIRASAFSPAMRGFREQQFRDFVQRHGLAGRRLLEVGCGRGEYLALLRQAGADACGLEAGAAAAAACLEAGLPVQQGFVADASCRLAGAPFAGFCIMNFLEHLPAPVASLRGVAANLEADAVGLVEVPNFDMILRRQLFSEFISDHLLYFTRATLATTLGLSGFEVLAWREVWQDYILSAEVRRCRPLDLRSFGEQQAQLTRELAAYVARFGERQVAVWGAGHQALAVLALAGLGGRIRYVVDSAPFKQGRYTPATHLPIVAPEMLRRDPVAAVIVMAAAYSDEVAATLRAQYDPRLDVAILRDYGLELPTPGASPSAAI